MKKIAFGLLFLISFIASAQSLPEGFVYLSSIDASIQKELRYESTNNFIGKPINGYHKDVVIVSKKNRPCFAKNSTNLPKRQSEFKNF